MEDDPVASLPNPTLISTPDTTHVVYTHPGLPIRATSSFETQTRMTLKTSGNQVHIPGPSKFPPVYPQSQPAPIVHALHRARPVHNALTQRLMQRPARPQRRLPRQKSYKSRRHTLPQRVEQLRQALDLTKYIEQVEKLIMQPIKIPSTVSQGLNRKRKQPSKPKHDLLSVKDVWRDATQRRAEMNMFFNTSSLNADRQFLLNMLLDESDEDSEPDDQIADDELAFMIEHRREAKRTMQAYHQDYLNTQFQFYSAGLLSEVDRHPEAQRKILELHEDMIAG